MTRPFLLAALLLALPLAPSWAQYAPPTAAIATPAQGPEHLRRLMADMQPTIAAFRAARARHDALACAKLEPQIRQLDRAAHQRDAYAAGLYWFTDLEQAKAAAARENKPILSLRLLGKLDEECSCANSRFFRTALYANQAVADHLREHFILHWQSVRPVPKITIDMGDGRKIERTLTGNSIHYILDAKGRVIDALPGLYGPGAFMEKIKEAQAQADQVKGLGGAIFTKAMAGWHEKKQAALEKQWAGLMAPLIPKAAEERLADLVRPSPFASGFAPTADKAAPLAKGKMLLEVSALGGMGLPVAPEATDDAAWEKAAALFAPKTRLDASSRGLMLEKASADMAQKAMRAAMAKRKVEDPMLRTVRAFESSLAKDTARNEFRFHHTLHAWLAQNPSPPLDAFNSRVYADLFLTPDDDPWLGLVPADTYAALDDEGLVAPAR